MGTKPEHDETDDCGEDRDRMVDTQLSVRGLCDARVLEVFRKVPRHRFVRPQDLNYAYDDHPLSIGYGQTISQPYMVALMTQELRADKNCKVLEIGTGSGYQTAILAELAGEVYTVERITELGDRAQDVLRELGYGNVHFRVGDGTVGWREEGPFDRIMVTAGGPKTPPSLTDQLADDGVMLIPIGPMYRQELTSVVKHKGKVSSQTVCGCVFVKLLGQEGWAVDGTDDADGGFL